MATAEDPMELSSEMNPLANAEDIDIDLITSDLPQEGEDDFMAEDITSATDQELPDIDPPQAGNDDEMFDDEYPSGEPQRNFSVHDEDLEDAEEPTVGYDENTTSATSEESIENQPIPQEEAADFAHANAKTHESNLRDLENIQEPASLSDLAEEHSLSNFDPRVTSLHDQNVPCELGDMPVAPDRSNGNAESRYDDQPEDLTGIPNAQEDEEGHSETPPVIHDVNANQSELLATNTDFPQTTSYVHPIVVVYQDNEMSLFPPVEQEQEQSQTYFLQDESYATGSINNLLGACRSVLGDSINGQNELEIQIEELGLHVSEFAPESYTTTLTEILDVYVQLQRHDGIDSPGPLYIVLCTKIRFSHRMKYLANAVAEGKGFSQLPLLESPDEDDPQSEYSGKQDTGGKDDLQSTDITTYTEVEDSRPVDIETRDVNKDDDSVEVDENIARSTPNNLGGHALNIGAGDIISPDGSTPLENEAKSTQLSSTRDDVSVSNELGSIREQNLISKVEGDTSVPSSVGIIGDTLGRSEDTAAAAEEENLINYEDEDGEGDVNHEFSTRSSTIQGDTIETSKVDSQQELARQALIPGNASRVLEEEETEVAADTENLEADNGEILDFDQEGEDFEQDHSQGDEHYREQDDNSSQDQENEPDVHKEGVYDENLSAKQGQTKFGPTHTLTEDYEDPDNQEIFLEDSEPWSQTRGNAPVALKDGDNSHEDNFDFTLDHTESGENQETAKANETLSNSYAHGSNFSTSVFTHTIADQEVHDKPDTNSDEINYEEEEDVDLSRLPAEHSGNASPGSLKRMRSDEADGLPEDDLQDLKRVRSR